MRAVRLWVGVAMLAMAGCEGAPPIETPFDAGPPRDRPAVTPDRPIDPAADDDGDGLCNGTEAEVQTDLTRPDTDDDGLLDLFELSIGSDPLNARNPAPSDRVALVEGGTSPVTVDHVLDWTGMGETLIGAVQDGATGLDGRVGSALAVSETAALEANPTAFVRDVNRDRFVGILGRAVLRWRVTVTPEMRAEPLGCRRAYEVFFAVKIEGGEVVRLRRLVLDVQSQTDGGVARWPRVSSTGHCLPARCL